MQALENPNSNGIASFVLGLLFMIVVYNTVLYAQHKSKVYLYYFMYTGLIILSILYYVHSDFFNVLVDPIRPVLFKFVAFFRWSYNLVYYLFVLSFVQLKWKLPKLHSVIMYIISALFAIGVIFQVTSLVLGDDSLMSTVFSRFFIPIGILISILGYYMLFKVEARFKEYVIVGSLFLIIASFINAAIYYLDLLPRDNFLRDSIFYFGVVAENVLFSLGLAHQQKYVLEKKNKIILAEKERQLSMIIETQERERGRIAQDLHDGVLQRIGGILLQVHNLVGKYNADSDSDAKQLIKNLENSNTELRNISHQMMPKSLTELGVSAALNDMLNLSLPYAKIEFKFEHFNLNERLPANIELVIFRVTQELVNNILKHSEAEVVSVQLYKAKGNIILVVEDDGVGFNPEEEYDGIGLMNIRSRLEAINGVIHIESSVSNGAVSTVKIPL